jgi:hypothetical protein
VWLKNASIAADKLQRDASQGCFSENKMCAIYCAYPVVVRATSMVVLAQQSIYIG